jgi:mannose-6-phosphate isomerase-like protein (cupin superfamily)
MDRSIVMVIEVINISKKLEKIKKLHSYKIIAQMNNYYFKLVKAHRKFVWHSHPKTDEVFIVLDGELLIELVNKKLHLSKGEMVVIPKGIEHRPMCEQTCSVMLIAPKDSINTGNMKGKLTDTKLEWI